MTKPDMVPNSHCKIGKVYRKHNLKVVEFGENNERADSTWRWPIYESLNLEGVQDVIVIARTNDANGPAIRWRSNKANVRSQLILIERVRHCLMQNRIEDD